MGLPLLLRYGSHSTISTLEQAIGADDAKTTAALPFHRLLRNGTGGLHRGCCVEHRAHRTLTIDGRTMSDEIRAAHARIKRHCQARQRCRSSADAVRGDTQSSLDGLLADLSRLPDRTSASKVFVLGEHEVGLPGVSLWVRSEELPYLRGAINAVECLVDRHGVEQLRSRGVVCPRESMASPRWR